MSKMMLVAALLASTAASGYPLSGGLDSVNLAGDTKAPAIVDQVRAAQQPQQPQQPIVNVTATQRQSVARAAQPIAKDRPVTQ